jgi:phage protein D
MSESTAATLASRIAGGDTAPNTTDPIVDEEVSQEEEIDETPVEDTTEETEEQEPEKEAEELPDAVKEILKKNRKAVREAEARALAAEKALAAKESGKEEATPSEADTKFKELYLNSAAKAALVEAGITTGTDRFLKMLDLSSVEVDDSGAISGLEDQIADLKEDFKDVLSPKTVKKSTGNVDGSRRVPVSVPKTSAELLASRLG